LEILHARTDADLVQHAIKTHVILPERWPRFLVDPIFSNRIIYNCAHYLFDNGWSLTSSSLKTGPRGLKPPAVTPMFSRFCV